MPKSRSRVIAATTYFFLLITGAFYLTSTIGPERMDADLVVQSLASLQNLTLFYWGQDRLLSVISLLLVPFRNIEWNLYFNTFLQASFFSGLVFLIVLTQTRKLAPLAISFLLSLLVIQYAIPHNELFTFAKHAQPYCASAFFLLVAYYFNLKGSRSWASSMPSKLCLILTAVALLLNPLSLILALCLPVANSLINSSSCKSEAKSTPRVEFSWIAAIAFSSIGLLIAKYFYTLNYDIQKTPYGLDFAQVFTAIPIVSGKFLASFHGNLVSLSLVSCGFIACLIVSLMAVFSRFPNKVLVRIPCSQFLRSNSGNNALLAIISISAILNLLSLIPILASDWLRLNDYDLRYFFPVYYVIIIGITTIARIFPSIILYSLSTTFHRHGNTQRFLPSNFNLLCLTLLFSVYLGSLRPIAPNLLTYNEISRVQPIYNYLHRDLPSKDDVFIGGSYWLSWPLKALSMNEGNNLGVLAERSWFDPISRQSDKLLDDHIRRREEFNFICLSLSPDINSCIEFISSKINNASDSDAAWSLKSLDSKLFTVDGDSYATTINYRPQNRLDG